MIQENWDFSAIYKSNEEFERDYAEAKLLLKELQTYEKKLELADKNIIYSYLLKETEFTLILEKLMVYARICYDQDSKDSLRSKNYQKINNFLSEADEKTSFSKVEFSKLSTEFLTELKNDNLFKDYDRMIEQIIREKEHVLPLREEKLFSSMSSFCNFSDIFDMFSSIEMNHGKVELEGKEIQLNAGNFNFYMKTESQENRKKIYETYLGEYKRYNSTIASLLISHVKYVNFFAKTHGFSSTFEMMTYKNEVDSRVMHSNIKNVSEKISLLQDYFKVKSKILKLDKFYVSDMFAEISSPKIDSKTQEKTNIHDEFKLVASEIKMSLSVLGKSYTDMFQKALDEGWFDVMPKANKTSGGYTISSYSAHPYILLNFDGTTYWKSAIAHEFGHAMHSYYSAKNQPYPKSDYTIFVAEVASLTNEILYNSYRLQNEDDPSEKIKIITDFLELFYLNVYNSTMLSEFEVFVHDKLWEPQELTAENLNQKMKELGKKYFGDFVELNNGYEVDWSRRSHLFMDFYLYQYSTGFVSACAIAQKLLSDKTGKYKETYLNFLKLGGSIDPISSLKFAGVDILDEKTYGLAFGMFESYLNELKNLI